MTAFSIVLILIGLFILVNAFNIVGVIQGNKSFSLLSGATAAPAATTPTSSGGAGPKVA